MRVLGVYNAIMLIIHRMNEKDVVIHKATFPT